MIEVPVLNLEGKEVGKYQLDEALLGTTVRPALLKQAYVRIHANNRQGTVVTKDRGEIEGSTKKLYAQKHTGNARRGNLRTNLMKGGGVAFGKRPRDFTQAMPTTQRKLARNNAILAKVLSNNLKLLENLAITAPKTKEVAKVLKALNADRSVLLALDTGDKTTYRAARNIARTVTKPALEVSAYDVLSKRTMIITKSGLDSVLKAAKKKA
jgi:large subunit ribosomal protein L4